MAPLYWKDRTLATDKEEKAKLLFAGTSVVHNECYLSDVSSVDNSPKDLDHQPVSKYEVTEVIHKLPTRKVKGGDGVPNELIKLAELDLVPILTHLFDTCLTMGYFPTAWRTATTAILRKHDKEDYSEAGAYRPIMLLSCLGKVFKTVLARRLTHWAETKRILVQGHMGGRRQHSTDDAFVILTSWIHQKWRTGKMVSGLFLDVKSAYPSVHKHRLADTLWKKQCPEYIVRQVERYLSNRTTHLRLQDYLSERLEVEDGLPQGSPLSVILYIIYNLNLLIHLDVDFQSDKISLGFIDDVTHLVGNPDIESNVLELEYEGERALRWGRKHGAIFDQKKAQVIHLTHKKHDNPKIRFGEQVLSPKQELRWLGLWLDPKLSFGPHIQKMCQRGKVTLAQMGRINKCFWGMSPRETKTLVTTVLKPHILFGCIVWYNTKTEGKVSQMLNLLQNSANRLALGAFKSSPVDLMNHDTNLILFKELVVQYNYRFVYKRLTAPTKHPTRRILDVELFNTPRRLLSPIHRILKKADIYPLHDVRVETIYPYPEPPWCSPTLEVMNKGGKREEVKERIMNQVEEEKTKGACVIFTDGAYMPNVGGGAAAALDGGVIQQKYGPTEGISNYKMVAMALILALLTFSTILTTTPTKYKSIAIFSDSQSALELLANPAQPKLLQYIKKLFRKAKRTIPEGKAISLYLTPGHKGVELNEKADLAAKDAAEATNGVIEVPVGLGSLLRHAREKCKREVVPVKQFKTKGRYIAEALNGLEKGQAVSIFQLQCGHCPLQKFLHQIGVEGDNKCDQ